MPMHEYKQWCSQDINLGAQSKILEHNKSIKKVQNICK